MAVMAKDNTFFDFNSQLFNPSGSHDSHFQREYFSGGVGMVEKKGCIVFIITT
jgi:hypothetical protein